MTARLAYMVAAFGVLGTLLAQYAGDILMLALTGIVGLALLMIRKWMSAREKFEATADKWMRAQDSHQARVEMRLAEMQVNVARLQETVEKRSP